MTVRLAVVLALAIGACGGKAIEQGGGPGPPEPAEKQPAGAADCGDATLGTFDQLAEVTGTRIALDGVPAMAVACTEKECTDGRACCNACEGEYALIDAGRQVTLRGLPGCSGMDCNIVCEPFGRTPTRTYRFVGTYDHAQRVLAVEKFCATN